MKETFYRIECDGLGIYEAVERDCPKTDDRRSDKPDGSWLAKVGSDYPGAVSFWTAKGLNKYQLSGLRDWHASVVNGSLEFITAEIKGEEALYLDELQVICKPSEVEEKRRMHFEYEGPPIVQARQSDPRPTFIRHSSYLRDWNAYAYYKGSYETFGSGASIGEGLGLEHIGVHHEIIKPGKRSSWPHAHKSEEELGYVLRGQASVWMNGDVYKAAPGDAIYFEPESNIAHTVMNGSEEDLEMLIFGEQRNNEDKIYYPLHPDRNQECRKTDWLWEDRPKVQLGDHTADPSVNGFKNDFKYAAKSEFILPTESIEPDCIGAKESPEKVYCIDRNLGTHWKTKRVALHHMVLPTGYRSSLPHAESHEEEFLYVLKGDPIAWVNGKRYQLSEGDCVAFPSGTGITHCFINESGADAEFIVSGERTKNENLCAFPLNPEQKESCVIWWDNPPPQVFGKDSAMPLTNAYSHGNLHK